MSDASPEFHHEPTEVQDDTYTRPATLGERFAAFFTDTLIFIYLMGGWAVGLTYLIGGNIKKPFEFHNSEWVLFASTGAALHFLYFFFFEGVLTATPGKFLTGISVHRKKGGIPSLFAVLIRNLFRVVDYPFFLFTGVGLMEATPLRQRLGDWVAGTMVGKEVSFESQKINLNTTSPSGATRRSLAFLFDLFLTVVFFYGVLLSLPADRTLVSRVVLPFVPLAILFYLSLSEWFFQTTFGKFLFGIKIVREDGCPAGLSTLLVRNFFLILDINPLGYLSMVLSGRKQRMGDILAGTLALKDKRSLRGLLAVPMMLLFAGGVAYLGVLNPHSFLKKDMVLKIGPCTIHPIPLALQRQFFREMHIESLEFGFNEEVLNRKATYSAGNLVYLIIDISGMAVRNGQMWVQADLMVKDNTGAIILNQPGILNTDLTARKKWASRLTTRFALHPQATPGLYEARLTVRDLLGNTSQEGSKIFLVNP